MVAPASAPRSVLEYIKTHLPLTPVPTVPEVSIHTAGPRSGLWRMAEMDADEFPSPYWASWWGGGVGLARHVLDHPEIVANKSVLDLGSGSGLVAIAAAKAGATDIFAADIDRYAIAATRLNAAANNVQISLMAADLTLGAPPDVDVVLVGDLFYEAELAKRVTTFLARCIADQRHVLIGDPRRTHLPVARVQLIAEYCGPDFGTAGSFTSRNGVYMFRSPTDAFQ